MMVYFNKKLWAIFLLAAVLLPVGGVLAAPADTQLSPGSAGKGKGGEAFLHAEEAVGSNAFGCILPLTGRFAPYGGRALEAIILAAGFFDPAKKSRIKLFIEDSQSRPEKAVAAVAKLARDGVIAIIGPLGSEESEAAAAEAQRLKISLITLTGKEGIADMGGYVFRNFLTGSRQIKSLVKYATNNLKLAGFAVLYPDDPYAQDMVRIFRNEAVRSGGKVPWSKSYKKDQTDFSGEIKEFADVKEKLHIDALFIPDSYQAVKMIVPQLVFHDVQGFRLLGMSGWNSPSLLSLEGGYLEGAVFTDEFFAESFYPETDEFVDAFYEAYGREPDAMEAEIFDTAGIVVKIIKENSAVTRDKFRDVLLNIKGYPGATGKTSFSATGDAVKEAFILTVKDGKIVQIK